jgi:hypothetical protein
VMTLIPALSVDMAYVLCVLLWCTGGGCRPCISAG